MLRYQRHNYLVKIWQLSKLSIYRLKDMSEIMGVEVQAGHFRPGDTYVEHGLLTMSLTGCAPKIGIFKHGKRRRPTLLIRSPLVSKWRWVVLNKIINYIMPMIGDLRTPKHRRTKLVGSTYSVRIRSSFELADSDPLLSDRVLRKDIYLPLLLILRLSSPISHQQVEQTLRMYRFPAVFYAENRPLAGDDILV